MSIAPLTPSPGFGVTPGFGINPSYGVSADPPRTAVDLTGPRQGTVTFGQVLAERIAALGPAAGAATTTQTPAAFGISPLTGTNAVQGATALSGTSGARAGAGAGMGDVVTDRLGQLQNLHSRSDRLAVAAVTGDLQDIHEYTIAANEAGVATQLAVSVRDRAVQAFNDIIRMQL